MNEITMKTTKGNTTINLRYVSAYTVNKVKGSMLSSDRYIIDVHMNSGTIFSAEVSEADYLIFKNKWSEKQ
tara:strand:+ start:4349 stop:4561 length:213 start_codon:yes stop_codon:yes gene_type:complete